MEENELRAVAHKVRQVLGTITLRDAMTVLAAVLNDAIDLATEGNKEDHYQIWNLFTNSIEQAIEARYANHSDHTH